MSHLGWNQAFKDNGSGRCWHCGQAKDEHPADFNVFHRQSGAWLARKWADSPGAAVAGLIAERGYQYYTPDVLRAERIEP